MSLDNMKKERLMSTYVFNLCNGNVTIHTYPHDLCVPNVHMTHVYKYIHIYMPIVQVY